MRKNASMSWRACCAASRVAKPPGRKQWPCWPPPGSGGRPKSNDTWPLHMKPARLFSPALSHGEGIACSRLATRHCSWRNPPVPDLEVWLLALTITGMLLGSCGILLARMSRGSVPSACGRGLFLATLLLLGGSSLLAAFHRAEGLAPLGLTAGFLVIFMLWEAPRRAWRQADVL